MQIFINTKYFNILVQNPLIMIQWLIENILFLKRYGFTSAASVPSNWSWIWMGALFRPLHQIYANFYWHKIFQNSYLVYFNNDSMINKKSFIFQRYGFTSAASVSSYWSWIWMGALFRPLHQIYANYTFYGQMVQHW